MLERTDAIGFAATKPILFDLVDRPGGDAVDVVALIEIAEIAAGVRRILVRSTGRRRMAELHVRIFLRHVDA